MPDKHKRTILAGDLRKLGFTEKSADVYSSIAFSGEATVLSVSKDTGLSRGTVYDLVETLKDEGYLSETKSGKRRIIITESPVGAFYTKLEKRHAELQAAKKIVNEVISIIQELPKERGFKPQVRIYRGEQGFQRVWGEILSDPSKEFVSIAKIEILEAFIGASSLADLQKRKIEAGVKSRAINEDSEIARKLMSQDKQYRRETRLAPDKFDFTSTEIIYGDKVALFSVEKEDIIVVIESRELAKTQRAYFEMMWDFLGQPDSKI